MAHPIMRRVAALLLVACCSLPVLAQPNSGQIDIYNFVDDDRGQDIWLTFADSTNWTRNASALPFRSMFRATFEERGFLMMFRPAGVAPDFLNPDFLSFHIRRNTTSRIILHGEHSATLIRPEEWGEPGAQPGLMLMAAGGVPGVVTIEDSRGTVTTFGLQDGRSSMMAIAPGEAVLTSGGRSYSIWLGSNLNYAFFVDGVWYGPSATAPIVPLERYVPGTTLGGVRVLNTLGSGHDYELIVDGTVVSFGEVEATAATSTFPVPAGDRQVQLKIDGTRVFQAWLKIDPKLIATIAVGDSAGSPRAWSSITNGVPSASDRALLRVIGTGSASDTLYTSIVRSDREFSTEPIGNAAAVHHEYMPGSLVVEVGRVGGDMIARSAIAIEAGRSYTVVPILNRGVWTLRRIDDTDPAAQALSAMTASDTTLSLVHIINLAGPESGAAITVANELTTSIDTALTLAPFEASMLKGSTGSVVIGAVVAPSGGSATSTTHVLPSFRTTFFIRPSANGPAIDRFQWYTPNEAPDDTAARVRFLSLVESDVEYSASLFTSIPPISFGTKRGRQRQHVTVPAGPATLKVFSLGQTAPVAYSTFDLPAGSVSTIVAVGSRSIDARFFVIREDAGAADGAAMELSPQVVSVREDAQPQLELKRTGDLISLEGVGSEGMTLEAYDLAGRRVATGEVIDLSAVGGVGVLVVVRDGRGSVIGRYLTPRPPLRIRRGGARW